MDEFFARLPKAELYLHIEGTLEPSMMPASTAAASKAGHLGAIEVASATGAAR